MIGIIDTGVDTKHKRFAKAKVQGVTFYSNSLGEIIMKEGVDDKQGHGTGIVSIILSHVPLCNLFVIKLDSHNGLIAENLLSQAISFLVHNTDVKIINISMGIKTHHPSEELREICQKAVEKGVVIIAAAYYLYNEPCYPAHFNSVVSVGQGIVKNREEFRYAEDKLTNVLAKGGFQRVAVPNDQFAFSTGTSLAAAHFTGIMAKAFLDEKWRCLQSLKKWLVLNSNNAVISLTKHDQISSGVNTVKANVETSIDELYDTFRPSKNIAKIAIFPFEEKEMNTIIEFNDLLPYELSLAIGFPRMLKFDKAIEMIMQKNINYTIKQLSDAEYGLFDTIVVGYFLDKLSDHNSYFGYNLIKECLIRDKNFIVWDKAVFDLIESIRNEVNLNYKGEVYFTNFDVKRKNMLYDVMDHTIVKSPSICVIGTNSRQGKFTTQLIIKKILQEYGYKVAHLSTEPQGIILGADMVFPIGHNGTIYVDVREWNKVLQLLTQLIEKKNNPDIIISGSQGGVLPLHPVNDSTPPEKLIYVKAFYPDALICTISPNDDVDFIKKTTDAVKSFVKTEVLFYVLTPWQYHFHHGQRSLLTFKKLGDDEYLDRLSFFNRNLNAPVINIKDKQNHPIILNLIQSFFSNK